MTTVNKAKVWAKVPSNRAKHLPRKFGELRLRGCVYQKDGTGMIKVGFNVPQDCTAQEAILLLSSLIPEGIDIQCC